MLGGGQAGVPITVNYVKAHPHGAGRAGVDLNRVASWHASIVREAALQVMGTGPDRSRYSCP
jgi:hypothetical protein